MSKPSSSSPTPERRSAELLPSACLLAFAGGSLDAFMYLEHGKVFAAAMTGNAVLTGVAILAHDRSEIFRHLLPILAFVAGVWMAKVFEEHLGRHAVAIGLAVEVMGLTIASFLPHGFPDNVFVPSIAMVAAYQVANFRTVENHKYNSTFITGNLRDMVESFYSALDVCKRADALREAIDLAAIIGSFIAGAFAGAMLAQRAYNHTLWLPIGALLIVLGIALHSDRLTPRKMPDR